MDKQSILHVLSNRTKKSCSRWPTSKKGQVKMTSLLPFTKSRKNAKKALIHTEASQCLQGSYEKLEQQETAPLMRRTLPFTLHPKVCQHSLRGQVCGTVGEVTTWASTSYNLPPLLTHLSVHAAWGAGTPTSTGECPDGDSSFDLT